MSKTSPNESGTDPQPAPLSVEKKRKITELNDESNECYPLTRGRAVGNLAELIKQMNEPQENDLTGAIKTSPHESDLTGAIQTSPEDSN